MVQIHFQNTFTAQRRPEISPVKNPVMTSHLPFPDIRAPYRQSCVSSLDHSQRVSHTPAYNCASSFSVKLKMSHCALPALFPDILQGQVASEKDTCLLRT